MRVLTYNIDADIKKGLTIAHISDLHGKRWESVLEATMQVTPDMIAITGDLGKDWDASADDTLAFLRKLTAIAPTFYSLGNHEIGIIKEDICKISETGTVILDDSCTEVCGIIIGGLTSGFLHRGIGNGRDNPHLFSSPPPNEKWLDEFEGKDGYKILLSHHPEYYVPYLKHRDIDLILSGHAHGGQIRFFGRGLLAPGQGFFPKYTSGVHENRLVISRGLANTGKIIPRLFNETELVVIKLGFNEKT